MKLTIFFGTVASKNSSNNIFTYILTGDKDSFQLISDKTFIVIPTTKMGKTIYTTYTPQLLKENQNIEPYQVIDIKSLMGDASDNIPGVKGIGEKTAYTLIDKYTTVDNIYENIESLDATPKIIEKLVNDKEMAFMSKKLATIDTAVPIDIDYDSCVLGDVDKPKIYELFKKLEFTKFMNKYDFSDIEISDFQEAKNNDEIINIKKELENIENIQIINTKNIKENLDAIIDTIHCDKVSYLLNGLKADGFLNVMNIEKEIFAIYSPSKNLAYLIDIANIQKADDKILTQIFKSFILSSTEKLGFNIKQDLLYFFNNIGENVHGFNFDIMIAYYLMDSNRLRYTIEYILKDIFGIEIYTSIDEVKQEQMSFFEASKTEEEQFITKEELKNIAIYLKGIVKAQDGIIEKLKNEDMLKLFTEIEMPLTETLASMEHNGMYIDKKSLDDFDVEISATILSLNKQIHELAGEEFNINSPQQLGKILFEKLNLSVVKKTKTGYSTDKAVLEKLVDEHPIIVKLLEYRQINKLKTTYVDGLKSKIMSDGRIHTTFMQTVASTGRLSSVEPNLQNIPVRLEQGKKIRSFFVAQNGNEIIDADYSQIELRVLAHISDDKTMIKAFNDNIDIHKVTASQVFDVPLDEVTSSMRSNAKAVNFGIVYGISEFGLAKNIDTTRDEAKKYIKNYLEKYHGIRQFMQNIVKEAKENGYVSTMFGRRRYIPELMQKNKNIIQFGERIAMNTPIQGTAADIIKLAMNKIYKKIKEKELNSKLIMQVHDELLIEVIPEELDMVKQIMHDAMENVIELKVPLNIDLNVGKSWYDAK
ncbi:MAG: DNA polymerase I [Clostridia bacterium]